MPALLRDYGGPFTGYVSSKKRHLAPLGAFTADSRDFEFDNLDGSFTRRAGSTNKAGLETFDTDVGVAGKGILETGYISGSISGEESGIRMRSLQGVALQIPSANITGAAYAEETYGFLFGDLRSTAVRYGQFYYRLKPSDGGLESNHVVADGMASQTTSSASHGAVQHNDYPKYMKISPEIGGGRFGTKYERATHAAGSHSCIGLGDHMVFGAYDGVPHRWNKLLGNAPSSVQNIERVFPVGNIPAMGVITVTKGSSNKSGSWQSGDLFWLAIIGERKDGSRTPPTVLRPPNPRFPAVYNSGARRRTTVGGYGLVLLDDGTTSGGSGTTDYNGSANTRYEKLTLSGLPIFDYDVVRRHIVRSPKVNGHLEGAFPPIADLRICLTIENNVDILCVLDSGADKDLAADESIVRYGGCMMPRARHLWHADGRVFAGGTRINPIGLILAPRLIGAAAESSSAAAYTPDDSNVCSSWQYADLTNEGGLQTHRYYFKLTSTTLTLYKKSATLGETPIPNTVFTLASYATIQDLVDALNAHGTGLATHGATDNSGGAGTWMAVVAPGADGNTAPTYLRATQTGASSGVGEYGDVVVSNTTTKTYDLQRAFGQCFPGYALFTENYLSIYGEQVRGVWYTAAGFGQPQNSANNWVNDANTNFRAAPESAGRLMGGAGLLDGCLLCYSNGIYILRNIKDGKSGEDGDYRIEPINETRGCISSWSIVRGNGWVGYLTREGYVIFSQGREINISTRDVYNPAAVAGERGIWEYEIGQCEAAASSGDAAGGLFYANALGSLLEVGFRSEAPSGATDDHPDLIQFYDMSAGVKANQGDAVVDPETGEPWGWSAPLSRSYSACVLVQGECLGAHDELTNNTGSLTKFFGRIDQFRVGTYDAQEQVAVASCQTISGRARIFNASNDLDTVAEGATMSFNGTSLVSTVRFPEIETVADCTLLAGYLTTETEFGFEHLAVADILVSGLTVLAVASLVSDEAVNVTWLSGPSIFSSATLTIPAQLATSGNASSTATATCTFTGRSILATGYTVTDVPDPVRRTFVRMMTPVYWKDDAGLRLAYSRFRNAPRNSETGWCEARPPACAADEPFQTRVLKVRFEFRGPGECIELRFRDLGTGDASKIWTVRAEGGLLNTRAHDALDTTVAPAASTPVISWFMAWTDERVATTQVYVQKIVAGAAAWTANGVVVSAATSGSYFVPRCAVLGLPDGGCVVLYMENISGTTKLRAQRFDKDGTKLWGSTGVEVSTSITATDGYGVRVVSDDLGGFYFGWHSVTADGFYVRRCAADGTFPWAEVLLGNNTGNNDGINGSTFELFSDGANGVYGIWVRGSSGAGVMGQRVAPDGSLMWSSVGVNLGVAGSHSTIAKTPARAPGFVFGGVLYIARSSSSATFSASFQIKRIDPADGSEVWETSGLEPDATRIPVHSMQTFATAAGIYGIWWDDTGASGNGRVVLLDDAGTQVWANPITFATRPMATFDSEVSKQMVVQSGLGVIIIYHDPVYEDETLKAVRVDEEGTVVWGPVSVSDPTGDIEFASACSDGQDGAVIGYDATVTVNDKLYMIHLKSDGTVEWGTPGFLVSGALTLARKPAWVAPSWS